MQVLFFVFVASLLLPSGQAAAGVNGLVAAYAFDEGSGATARDVSGDNVNGTIVGATWVTPGRFGNALSFNGSSNRVTASSVPLGSSFTMMAWVYNPSNAAYETIITVGTSRDLYLRNGVITFYEGATDRAFGTAISTNAWHHVAIVSDGATLSAYVDGTPRGAAQAVALGLVTGTLQVGAWILGSNNYDFFGGTIDEIRVYNRALPPSEIQAQMNNPVSAPDTTPPVVSISTPAQLATVSGTTTVAADASDNGVVAGVQFLLDGQNLGLEDTSAPFSILWDTTQVPNGSTHTLAARARDAAGNTGTSATVTVTVDNTPTTLLMTAPGEGSTVAGSTVDLLYSVSGNLSTYDHAHFRLDDGPTVMDIDGDGAYRLTNVPVGPHVLVGIAARSDHSEIAGSQDSVSFTTVADPADPSRPTVRLTAPLDGSTVSGTISITAEASDDRAIAGVHFSVNDVEIGSDTTPDPYAVPWNTTTRTNGPYTITALARDTAGNETTSPSVRVTVDNNPTSPAVIGQWSAVMTWPIASVHTALQASGEVLIWDEFNGGQAARIWNPNTGALTSVPVASDIFCAGHAALADGRSVVIGGQLDPCCKTGIPDTNLYNSATRTWTRVANMNSRRWYPTATTLPDGRILAISGWSTPAQLANVPEVYDPRTNRWTALTAAARSNAMYSFMFVLPNGTVFDAGPGLIDGAGSTMTWTLDVNGQQWTTVGNSLITGHSAVMYSPGRVLKSGTLGDVDFPLPSVDGRAVVIDMTQPSPAWRQVAPMAFPRSYHHLTLLPDGTVLATGGERSTSGDNTALAVYEAELWNLATETWTTLARMQRPRLYHSTAVLLPDARVLVSGGELFSYLEANAELYSPPYLFKGPRPSITFVPQTLAYGANFSVETPDASTIARVSLVRLGSTTHGFDQNQRYLSLGFTQGGTGLTVQAPASENLAPPGYYMLFIVNANGVPSVAPFVRLPAPSEDSLAPTPPTNLVASASSGPVALGWSAATDNIGVVRYNVHRATTAGFSPTAANRIAQPAGTSYSDAGPAPGTYYYRVTAEDAAGNVSAPSNEASVVVQDSTPPVRSNGQPSGTLAAGTRQATLSLTTGESATCRYSTTPGVAYGAMANTFATTGGTTHSTLVTGLADGQSYSFYARCQDTSGNANPDDLGISFSVAAAPPPGLVAAYSFNQGSGGTATDASGSGNHGTISGATWTSQGRYGNALSFDGVNDRVAGPSVTLGATFTIMAWVYNPTNASRETIVTVGTNRLLYLRSGVITFYDGTADRAFGSAISRNVWHHVAIVSDGATLRAYVNGAPRGTTRSVALGSVTGALQVGARIQGASNDRFFGGRIDEVRVYNRARTQAEIQTDMSTVIAP